MVDAAAHKSFGRSIAVTQTHRGHGTSTAAYYLGRTLVSLGLRVLLVDLTNRHDRLLSLARRGPVKNLVLWTPSLGRARDVAPALQQARMQTAGKADVLLIDTDAALIEEIGLESLSLHYTCILTEPAEKGQEAADSLAERLRDAEPPYGHAGVVFSRVDAPAASELPQQTAGRHLPVLGYFPADYLLAGGDAYSLKGDESTWPHETYISAITRISQKLARIVPLERATHSSSADISGAHVSPVDRGQTTTEPHSL